MGQPQANAEQLRRPLSFSRTTLVECGILALLVVLSGAWYLQGGGYYSKWNITWMVCSVLVPYLVPLLATNTCTPQLFKKKNTTSCAERQRQKNVDVPETVDRDDNGSLTVVQEEDKQSLTPSESNSQQEETSHDAPPSPSQPITQRTISVEEQSNSSHVAKYVDGRLVYADGSPAHVPAGDSPTELPSNFLDFCHGNHKHANKQWQQHQNWRKERNVWKIHTKPDPCFDAIKKAYPHVCHGRSKQGWAVMYEHPGGMDVKRMFHSDITNEDILHHDVFVLEYVANVLHPKIVNSMTSTNKDSNNNNEPPPSWGMMGVLDLANSRLSEFLSRDVIHYLTMISNVNDAHYPLHVKKIFMINAPYWMAHVFRVIRPVLPKTLAIEVLGSNEYVDALREYIDDDELAQEFGGTSPYKLGEHPYELDLVKLATEGTTTNDDTTSSADVDKQTTTVEEQPETTPTELSRETTSDTTKSADSGVTSSSLNEAKFFWPVRLPSLCSTILSNSSQEGSERDDDDEDTMMSDNSSTNEDSNNNNRSTMRKSFLRTGGPLRPRLPSFEPVLSPDEEERVMATLYNRNRAATETSYSEEDGDNSYNPGDDDDKDAPDSFLGCDTLWSTVLSTCG